MELERGLEQMTNRIMKAARAGFTLVEVLVTLVLIALLVGVIVPSVVNQLDKGDPTRIMSDLEGVRSGVKMFRIDVKRYPSTLEQLTIYPDDGGETYQEWTDSTSLPTTGGGNINTALKKMWSGPYVEGMEITDPTSDTHATALGGEILGEFAEDDLGGVTYLVVQVDGLTQEDIEGIDEAFDDDATATGRIQLSGAGSELDPYILNFFAVPLN